MTTSFTYWARRTLPLVVVGVVLVALLHPTTAVGQAQPTQRIATVGDNTGTLGLYKPEGGGLKMFALLEIKGSIEFDDIGVRNGEVAFLLRLQTTDAPDKWLKITSRELVKGRVVITTDDTKVYTIYELQGNFVGKIMTGRFLE